MASSVFVVANLRTSRRIGYEIVGYFPSRSEAERARQKLGDLALHIEEFPICENMPA